LIKFLKKLLKVGGSAWFSSHKRFFHKNFTEKKRLEKPVILVGILYFFFFARRHIFYIYFFFEKKNCVFARKKTICLPKWPAFQAASFWKNFLRAVKKSAYVKCHKILEKTFEGRRIRLILVSQKFFLVILNTKWWNTKYYFQSLTVALENFIDMRFW
jgi:hypothetical protein